MKEIEDILSEAAREGAFDTELGRGRPYRVTDTGPGWWIRRKVAEIRDEDEAAGRARPLPEPWTPPKKRVRDSDR